jgi:hypothetical protein
MGDTPCRSSTTPSPYTRATDVIPSPPRYAPPGLSTHLHLHLPLSLPRTTIERLRGVTGITRAMARGPVQDPHPRRRGAACWTWSRSSSVMSPPLRTVVAWSNLPDGMDDFPWCWPSCGDVDVGVATESTVAHNCGHAPVPLLPRLMMSVTAGGDPSPMV